MKIVTIEYWKNSIIPNCLKNCTVHPHHQAYSQLSTEMQRPLSPGGRVRVGEKGRNSEGEEEKGRKRTGRRVTHSGGISPFGEL